VIKISKENTKMSKILERIALGEDSYTEFKAVKIIHGKVTGPKQNDLADEIAAFANTSKGGTIFFGIADNKIIEGIQIENLQIIEEIIRNACIDSIDPPLYSIHSEHKKIPDLSGELKNIIELKVDPSLFVHRSPGGFYVRICDAKSQMKTDILARLFQIRSQARMKSFDEFPVPNSSLKDLRMESILPFFEQNIEIDSSHLSKSRILVEDEDGNLKLSVAGALLFSNFPQQYFPNACIECVKFRGNIQDTGQQLDANRIEGNLFNQIDEAFYFVQKNMFVKAIKNPDRIEIKQFSERAIFESIVNAIAHRDYSIYGSKIRLFMFDNRFEIRVPGSLPNSVTIDSLNMRQFTRNELITRFLGRTSPRNSPVMRNKKYMETRGDGVPLILNESFSLSNKMPEYKMNNDELMLTIWGA
jgi:ATP-dependent DNA helicase RecG